MRTHRSIGPAALLACCLALALALPPAVRAQEATPGEPQPGTPSEMAREGLEQMLRALRLLVQSIPQYELPEVLENGDIIIRRKHPEPEGGEPEGGEPEIDETAT